jgi:hypothetical protein
MTISDTICLFDICQSTGSYCRIQALIKQAKIQASENKLVLGVSLMVVSVISIKLFVKSDVGMSNTLNLIRECL